MAIKNQTITIYVPITTPYNFENLFGHIKVRLQELVSLSGDIVMRGNSKNLSKLGIILLDRRSKYIRSKFEHNHLVSNYLKFSTTYSINDDECTSDEWSDYINFSHLSAQFITHLLVYLNIPLPGGIRTQVGIVETKQLSNGVISLKENSFPSISSTYDEALSLILSGKDWPKIRTLEIKKSIHWLTKHWDAFQGQASNRIQRSLNAFSYLFHENFPREQGTDLFYSVLGIEALFVSGNGNILSQVDLKTQLLLGKRESHKKRFNTLYDLRSRYIHGQLNVVNKFHSASFDDESFENLLLPVYDNSLFSMLILVASIQKHLEFDVTELEFETVMKSPKK